MRSRFALTLLLGPLFAYLSTVGTLAQTSPAQLSTII
jgi:hypothetical protein